MKKIIKAPPISTQSLIPGNKLAEALQCLIGQHLSLKAQIRTIGSNLRKMIEEVITELSLPGAVDSAYKLQTKKGLPKIMIALCDSYVVTTGNSYNLQVWNRRPNSHVQLVKYSDGSKVMCKDIRCILVKINTEKELIESIVIMTPDYIEKHFGAFGVPTVKYQLIISESKRKEILETDSSMLIGNDTETMKKFICKDFVIPEFLLAEEPRVGKILSIDVIKRMVADHLIGVKLQGVNTKTCGQDLERKVAKLLGYNEVDVLVGGYPDIKNQVLEVKVQKSSTIDLGKESPSVPTKPFGSLSITTEDVRYLIALVDPKTNKINGVVLMSGSEIVEEFSLVGDTSYKCQRSIPMSFFDKYVGKSVFNP